MPGGRATTPAGPYSDGIDCPPAASSPTVTPRVRGMKGASAGSHSGWRRRWRTCSTWLSAHASSSRLGAPTWWADTSVQHPRVLRIPLLLGHGDLLCSLPPASRSGRRGISGARSRWCDVVVVCRHPVVIRHHPVPRDSLSRTTKGAGGLGPVGPVLALASCRHHPSARRGDDFRMTGGWTESDADHLCATLARRTPCPFRLSLGASPGRTRSTVRDRVDRVTPGPGRRGRADE
jgi:hypothetical protein